MMSAELLREEDQQASPQLESQPPGAEGAREGDGQGRRRRRRGGRGGERNRGDRGPRESFASDASPADAIESRAAEIEEAKAPAARHEAVEASRDFAPVVHEHVEARSEPAQQPTLPVAAAFTPHAPVAFRSVSQHDEVEGESGSHRPQRKRRQGEARQDEPQQLQLVETQFDAPAPAVVEDDTPRRTKPRRRRAQPTESEPLKLVETHPGTQPPQDGAPTQ